MPDTLEDVKDYREAPERRSHPRHQVRSLAYIELDEGNGGILLNVSESGLAVQAVTPLIDEFLPHMRLQLSQTAAPIAAVGQIVWTANLKKVAGIRFLDFSPEAASQIKEWVASEAFPLEPSREDHFPREATEVIAETAANPYDPAQHEPSDLEKETKDRASNSADDSGFHRLDADAPDLGGSIANPVSAHAMRFPADSRYDANLKPDVAHNVHSSHAVELSRSSWLLYALIGILAVCSTAAGWSVGKTGLYGALGRFRALHSDTSAADPVQSTPIEAAKLIGIEIVELNNRRWYVPFTVAVSNAPVTPRPQPVASLPPARHQTKPPSRGWTLASSGRPTAAKPRLAEADAPPTLSRQSSGTPGAGASLAAISIDTNIPPPLPPTQSSTSPVVEPAQLIRRIEPVYPRTAGELFSSDATVRMHVTIGLNGQVQEVKPVSGPPLFFQAAMDAIREWRYRPAQVDGKPSVSDGEVSIVFRHAQ